jgi:glycerol-3-phosphate dehydrogenase
MQTILEKGGHVMNYMQVSSFTKNESGKIVGVTATDTETGMNYPFFSKVVVNATGVFTDAILQMDQPGCRKTIRASQGVHLVLERRFYTAEHALMIPKTSDGRVLFAVPWHNKVVVGTTDTPIEDINLEPTALKSEIDFILETSAAYLTNKPQRKDVLSVFAGLRPLAAPQSNKQKTKEISRSHKIIVPPSGLYTILGGKWTTFRKMGEDMINRIELQLNWPRRNGSTKELPIHGATENINLNDVLYYYGSDAVLLKQEMQDSGMKWLSTSLSIHEMQVRWAVRKEMARTVDDFLSRRCRALLLDAEESVRMAPIVARIMAEELGKDERWEKAQVAAFEKLALSYQLKEA